MKYFLLVTVAVAFQMPNGNDMMLIERLSNSMGARVNDIMNENLFKHIVIKYGALTPSLFPTVSGNGGYRKLNLKSMLANSWMSQESGKTNGV